MQRFFGLGDQPEKQFCGDVIFCGARAISAMERKRRRLEEGARKRTAVACNHDVDAKRAKVSDARRALFLANEELARAVAAAAAAKRRLVNYPAEIYAAGGREAPTLCAEMVRAVFAFACRTARPATVGGELDLFTARGVRALLRRRPREPRLWMLGYLPRTVLAAAQIANFQGCVSGGGHRKLIQCAVSANVAPAYMCGRPPAWKFAVMKRSLRELCNEIGKIRFATSVVAAELFAAEGILVFRGGAAAAAFETATVPKYPRCGVGGRVFWFMGHRARAERIEGGFAVRYNDFEGYEFWFNTMSRALKVVRRRGSAQ